LSISTLSRIKTWATSDTLTAADLNAEFNNIVNDYNGSIVNANIGASAAIAYSKLSLTDSILNADINSSAAIASSKLATDVIIAAGEQTLTGKKTLASTIQTITTETDAATVTFNLDTSNIQQVTLEGNRTLAISNEDAGQVFVIKLIQDGTGSRTVTWFSTIKWAGGSAPTLTTTASKADTFGFITTGTDTYDGFVIGQNI